MAVQDQILLLVDLDETDEIAVQMLVDHMHSIPVSLGETEREPTTDCPGGAPIRGTTQISVPLLESVVRQRSTALFPI